MGQQAGGKDQLFYSFNLEAHVPANHLLRGVDRFLDLSDLRKHLAAFYSHTGRPSIDPELTLLLRHPIGAAAVRGGASESRLPLVLPARPGRRGAGSLELLQEPAWSLPREWRF